MVAKSWSILKEKLETKFWGVAFASVGVGVVAMATGAWESLDVSTDKRCDQISRLALCQASAFTSRPLHSGLSIGLQAEMRLKQGLIFNTYLNYIQSGWRADQRAVRHCCIDSTRMPIPLPFPRLFQVQGQTESGAASSSSDAVSLPLLVRMARTTAADTIIEQSTTTFQREARSLATQCSAFIFTGKSTEALLLAVRRLMLRMRPGLALLFKPGT